MDCKPQIPLAEFKDMESTDDKLIVLYGMQASTMECLGQIKDKMEKRKLFDRISVIGGSIVGGVLGALGISQVR